MLQKATLADIRRYGETFWRLALDPAGACYPAYWDGIKTKADFLRAAEAAATGSTSECLLFSMDGSVEGQVSYFWIPAEQYLQLTGCCLRCGTQQALAELLDRLTAAFQGYTAHFGFPGENRSAAAFLAGHGFSCVERGWDHAFFFDAYSPGKHRPRAERITRQTFDAFRKVYHPDAGTYWTADRILEAAEDWTVLVYPSAAAPAAAVFLTGSSGYFEIYGTAFLADAFQEEALGELLTAALGTCKALGGRYLTYICPEREKQVLGALGFRCVGEYVLYEKTL